MRDEQRARPGRRTTTTWGLGVFALIAAAACSESQPAPTPGSPPLPFEDVGACPFECCVYREWTTRERTELRSERSRSAPVVATLEPDARVTGRTGVVVTEKAGRAVVLAPLEVRAESGASLSLRPGDEVAVLHPEGEGVWLCWFAGERVLLDLAGALSGTESQFRVDASPDTRWWMQIETADGTVGWSDQPEHFGNKDACG